MSQASNKFLAAIAAAASIGALQGCALTECLEYQDQVVTRQVCDRYSDTGSCASSHTETGTRSVCVRRAEPGTKVEKPVNPRAAFDARMDALREHFPPQDFEACIALEGAWYGECLSKRDGKCVEATKLEGRCVSHIIPDARDLHNCHAAGGRIDQPCERYDPTFVGRCQSYAIYGTCRQPLAFEDFSEVANLIQLDATGSIRNPAFIRRGKTREEHERELAVYEPIPSPTNHAYCTGRKGSWYGACTRSEGGRCLEASRSKGLCRSYVSFQGSSNPRICAGPGDRYTKACLAYRTDANGKDVCVASADFGVCITDFPRKNELSSETEKLYLLEPDGAIAISPSSGEPIWTTEQHEHMKFRTPPW